MNLRTLELDPLTFRPKVHFIAGPIVPESVKDLHSSSQMFAPRCVLSAVKCMAGIPDMCAVNTGAHHLREKKCFSTTQGDHHPGLLGTESSQDAELSIVKSGQFWAIGMTGSSSLDLISENSPSLFT